VRVYTLQMVKAIMFIHEKNIVHRDLKLGNILIN
jgi:serine/threonine protein kinase